MLLKLTSSGPGAGRSYFFVVMVKISEWVVGRIVSINSHASAADRDARRLSVTQRGKNRESTSQRNYKLHTSYAHDATKHPEAPQDIDGKGDLIIHKYSPREACLLSILVKLSCPQQRGCWVNQNSPYRYPPCSGAELLPSHIFFLHLKLKVSELS